LEALSITASTILLTNTKQFSLRKMHSFAERRIPQEQVSVEKKTPTDHRNSLLFKKYIALQEQFPAESSGSYCKRKRTRPEPTLEKFVLWRAALLEFCYQACSQKI
jgi:hypothetical protein